MAKYYSFGLYCMGFLTNLSVKASRLGKAYEGLEAFYRDIGIPNLPVRLCSDYFVYTDNNGVVTSPRNYSIKSDDDRIYSYVLCSPYSLHDGEFNVIPPSEFIRVLRDLDEQETRPENLFSEGIWYVHEH